MTVVVHILAVVMCGLGSAHKPRLRLGLDGSRPAQDVSRALSPPSREPGQAVGSGRGLLGGLRTAMKDIYGECYELIDTLSHLSMYSRSGYKPPEGV